LSIRLTILGVLLRSIRSGMGERSIEVEREFEGAMGS